MDAEDLRAFLRKEVDSATNYLDEGTDGVPHQVVGILPRRQVRQRSRGPVSGRLTEVADTIDFMMPSLMRIFTATDEYGRFVPRGPEDVAGAQQATDYCGYNINSVNNGFVLLHNWFKDALLFKIGVVKSYYDERIDTTEESYEALDDAQWEALQADPDVDVISHEEIADPMGRSHAATVRRSTASGQIRHENVPPEEFLVERRARGDVQSLGFCAHRTEMTVSDLVAMGYDREEVEEHAGEDEDGQEEQVRFEDLNQSEESDRKGANREVIVTEAYIRFDYDGDGIAELRRVLCIGETLHVLENEPWDRVPLLGPSRPSSCRIS